MTPMLDNKSTLLCVLSWSFITTLVTFRVYIVPSEAVAPGRNGFDSLPIADQKDFQKYMDRLIMCCNERDDDLSFGAER